MKKSELTAFIKEEIKSTLTTEGVWSRGNDVEIQQFITAVDQLKREFYDVVGSDDVFNGLDQAISAAQELAAMNEDAQTQQDIKDTEELTKAMDKLAKSKKEAGLNEEEEKEPTKTQLTKGAGSLTRLGYKLADVTKEMKSLARKYKKAEGTEKEKIIADLKKMTKIKKELEAAINK
jgi:predicted RND superfamily exporter protein